MENTKFKVYIEEKTQDYGRIFIEPLERGYGDTLGNALRRLLLSSIRGAAVIAVNIEGILHEFSTIPGVREDVLEILMNLKRIPIKAKNKDTKLEDGYKVITLNSKDLPKDFFTREVNPGTITARDMPFDYDFEFCGDGVLCTLEPDANFVMEIYVQIGTGYLSAERPRPSQPSLTINALLTDAIFSPVKRVNYQIIPARVGQTIDYDKLMLEVWTNGAVTPEEAVEQASRIAEDYFKQIAETVMSAPIIAHVEETKPEPPVEPTGKDKDKGPKPPKKPNVKRDVSIENRSIQDLNLSIRSVNCLRRGNIETVGDLLRTSRDTLLKFRHLGKKSLDEIDEKLAEYGLALSLHSPEDSLVEEQPDDFTSPKTGDELVDEIMKDTEDIVDKASEKENKEKEAIVEAEVKESELLPGVFDEPEAEQESEAHETVEDEEKETVEEPKPKSKAKKVKEQKEKKVKADKKSDKPKTKSKAKTEKTEDKVKDKEKVIEEPVAEEIKEPEKIEAPEIPDVKEPEKPKKSKTVKKTKKTEKSEAVEAVEEIKEVEEVKQEKKEKEKKSRASKKSEAAEKPEKPKTKSKTKSKSEEKVKASAVVEEIKEVKEVKPKKSKAVKTTKTSSKAAKAEKTKKSDTKSETKTKKTRKKKE